MRTRVQKWGNSLALRIPKAFAEDLKMCENTVVDVAVENDALVIRRAAAKCSLAELLAGVTDENIHGEVNTGGPVGREEW